MKAEEGSVETVDAFLTHLGDTLSAKEGVDVGLADIVKVHLLQAVPEQDAVAQAKAAISQLAAERAALPRTEESRD